MSMEQLSLKLKGLSLEDLINKIIGHASNREYKDAYDVSCYLCQEKDILVHNDEDKSRVGCVFENLAEKMKNKEKDKHIVDVLNVCCNFWGGELYPFEDAELLVIYGRAIHGTNSELAYAAFALAEQHEKFTASLKNQIDQFKAKQERIRKNRGDKLISQCDKKDKIKKGKKVVDSKSIRPTVKSKGDQEPVEGGQTKEATDDRSEYTITPPKVIEDRVQIKLSEGDQTLDSKAEEESVTGEKFLKISASLELVLEKSCVNNVYTGVQRISSLEMKKACIMFPSCDIDELLSLCAEHEEYLKVDYSVPFLDDASKQYLVTEKVIPLQQYFMDEFLHFTLSAENNWWDYIHKKFWTIFRDVSRGLLFLIQNKKFHWDYNEKTLFVTTNSNRGRILPTASLSEMSVKSTNSSNKQLQYMTKLITLMKECLYISSEQNAESLILPCDLTEFLCFPSVLSGTLGSTSLPTSLFLLDHPFFWTKGEKIMFTENVWKLFKRDNRLYQHFRHTFCFGLTTTDLSDWENRMNDLQKAVYIGRSKDEQDKNDKSNDKQDKNDKSKDEQDQNEKANYCELLRFFHAYYNHVNDKAYKAFRNFKGYSDLEIESQLSSTYPEIYSTVYLSLWTYHARLRRKKNILNRLSNTHPLLDHM